MKNALKVFSFVLAMLIVGGAAGYIYFTWNSGDFKFEQGANSGTVVITGYVGEEKDVKIPSSIHGSKVIAIGEEAFAQTDIVSVEVSDSVININDSAFSGCKKLEKVVLGKAVRSIGDTAFEQCGSLVSFTANADLQSWGQAVFGRSDKLKTINFKDNGYFKIVDGVIYSKDMTRVYEVLSSADLSNYKLPEKITVINSIAFANHRELKHIELNSGIVAIENGAFMSTGLTEIVLPSTVTKIGALAFADSDLKKITISYENASIDKTAFYKMRNELTIIAGENSSAYKFAKENNIKTSVL